MKELSIAGNIIPPGIDTVVNLSIARLPSGTKIELPIYVFRSKQEGPIVLLSAGLHGDEINGVEIVRRLIDDGLLKKLNIGSVIAVPIMNIYGFLNFSREVPDGKDVNRSFPGSKNGSLASVVAYNLTHAVLKEIDCGLDFHTGGASRFNYPQVRYTENDPVSFEIANAFNAPIRIASKLIDKSIRKQSYIFQKPFVVYEGGESLRFDEFVISEGVRGAKRVLHHLNMIDNPEISEQNCLHCPSTKWIRARSAGLFTSYVKSGDIVQAKQPIGRINDPFGAYKQIVKAPESGIIIGHNNMPVLNRGDALFHLGSF